MQSSWDLLFACVCVSLRVLVCKVARMCAGPRHTPTAQCLARGKRPMYQEINRVSNQWMEKILDDVQDCSFSYATIQSSRNNATAEAPQYRIHTQPCQRFVQRRSGSNSSLNNTIFYTIFIVTFIQPDCISSVLAGKKSGRQRKPLVFVWAPVLQLGQQCVSLEAVMPFRFVEG